MNDNKVDEQMIDNRSDMKDYFIHLITCYELMYDVKGSNDSHILLSNSIYYNLSS